MRALLAGILGGLVLAAPAGAATEVGANGNAFTGGLSFAPASVTVPVGEVVGWRNTDFLVPHTTTEDHALWELTGAYGGTPLNPPGYAPGTLNSRPFEAGTHHYYCRVHPVAMRGTVAVPVTLATEKVRVKLKRKARRGKRGKKRRGNRRRARFKNVTYVVAAWAASEPDAGLVFDVERRRAGGDWTPLRIGTLETAGRFRAGAAGTVWEVRARLRSGDSPDRATDWSPPASISG